MNENNRRYLAKQMEQQVIRLREQLLQAQRLEEDAALIRQEVAQAMNASKDQDQKIREVVEPQLPEGSHLIVVPGLMEIELYSIDVPDAVEQARKVTNTEGVAGRPVQHIDAPADDEDSGLPDTVWVPFSDLALGQSQHASATDKDRGALLQVIMLTDEQMAKIDTYVRG
ncbi:hypothetical protein Q3G72_031448 [Acer saccharum]|nr:hypothetical protein Q3G72_031448 [Acer saccharum]